MLRDISAGKCLGQRAQDGQAMLACHRAQEGGRFRGTGAQIGRAGFVQERGRFAAAPEIIWRQTRTSASTKRQTRAESGNT